MAFSRPNRRLKLAIPVGVLSGERPSKGSMMAVAIIGLAGAALGALITLFGGMLSEERRNRRDEATWRRDKRAEAYDGALRHLLRAANLRSEFLGGTGAAVLKTEHQREFFDDLVQGQFWLHTASRYSTKAELDTLHEVTGLLDAHVLRLTSGVRYDEKDFSIWGVLQACIQAISGAKMGVPAGVRAASLSLAALNEQARARKGDAPHAPDGWEATVRSDWLRYSFGQGNILMDPKIRATESKKLSRLPASMTKAFRRHGPGGR